MATPYFASINGEAVEATALTVSVWDDSLQRGDGVFEVIYVPCPNKLRSVNRHLDRLERSAKAIDLSLPEQSLLSKWLNAAAIARGSVRLMVTRGGKAPSGHISAASNVFVVWQPLPEWPSTFSLQPQPAPWHPAGRYGYEAIKWLSYGPNRLASRTAQATGFDDALLVACDSSPSTALEEMRVLDGPNFSIGWVSCEDLYFPCWKMNGLLQSITQTLISEHATDRLGIQVHEGTFVLHDVLEADEVFVMSCTRGIIPVTRIGDVQIAVGTFVPKLQQLLDDVTAAYDSNQ